MSDLSSAKRIAFKHSLRSHIVTIRNGKDDNLEFGNEKWSFQCNRCGMHFDDNLAWVTHMTRANCIKKE